MTLQQINDEIKEIRTIEKYLTKRMETLFISREIERSKLDGQIEMDLRE